MKSIKLTKNQKEYVAAQNNVFSAAGKLDSLKSAEKDYKKSIQRLRQAEKRLSLKKLREVQQLF